MVTDDRRTLASVEGGNGPNVVRAISWIALPFRMKLAWLDAQMPLVVARILRLVPRDHLFPGRSSLRTATSGTESHRHLRGRRKEASILMPRVHRIAGLLKRWLLGTHQGAVAPQHLSYYLDEFTFRFNRRKSKSRGKLFFRLMQQSAGTSPKTYGTLIGRSKSAKQTAQQVGVG